ncbi:hypothetical protein BCR35DRAFT_827 [Leucosporidium creatinivorum]|uniref:RRM domain-containing protein n=1 Tax=Leucosporidium creatinivorum TaxID=106004 RepID=A0A1Y2G3B7_9BASI|nr:hypothetical protein BCR35DRAFT_827 [Leucosporidium creatinivorum]
MASPDPSFDHHHLIPPPPPPPLPLIPPPPNQYLSHRPNINSATPSQLRSPSWSQRPHTPVQDSRTQLFVSNLPFRVRWQDLKDLMRKCGTVLRADVALTPSDGRSRGFGVVLFSRAEDALKAIEVYHGYSWQTRILDVRIDSHDPRGELALAEANRQTAMQQQAERYQLAVQQQAVPVQWAQPPNMLGQAQGMFGGGAGGLPPNHQQGMMMPPPPPPPLPNDSSSSNGLPPPIPQFPSTASNSNPSTSPLLPSAAVSPHLTTTTSSSPNLSHSSTNHHHSATTSPLLTSTTTPTISNHGSSGERTPNLGSLQGEQMGENGGLHGEGARENGARSEQDDGRGTPTLNGDSFHSSAGAGAGYGFQQGGGGYGGPPPLTQQQAQQAQQMVMMMMLMNYYQQQQGSQRGLGPSPVPAQYVGRHLFVGNLPFNCQWQELKDLMRQCGSVLRADIAQGPDGRSRGFGSVLFATSQDAERAVQQLNIPHPPSQPLPPSQAVSLRPLSPLLSHLPPAPNCLSTRTPPTQPPRPAASER